MGKEGEKGKLKPKNLTYLPQSKNPNFQTTVGDTR